MDDVKRGPEWIGKRMCSRHSCSSVSEADTEMGPMCAKHANPLMFAVQHPYREPGEPRLIPWEMIKPHEQQALSNHCMQTLARLSQRGGLSAAETVAVLKDRPYRTMERPDALRELAELTKAWGDRAKITE
jgi:hypothetical protein